MVQNKKEMQVIFNKTTMIVGDIDIHSLKKMNQLGKEYLGV